MNHAIRAAVHFGVLAAALLSIPTSFAQAQTCGNTNLNGNYIYQFGGSIKNPSNANATLSYDEDGKLTFNGAGGISGSSTTSTAGSIALTLAVTGSYTVNPNCSGTVTLTTGAATATLAIQVYDGGANALVSVTSAPTTGQLGSGHFYRVAGSTGSQCGNGSAQGVYVVSLTGGTYINGTRTSYDGQFQATLDGKGGVTVNGEYTNAAGTLPFSGSGTYAIGADCTGTMSVNIGSGQATNLWIAKLGGGSVEMLDTDANTTISGTATPQANLQVLPQFVFGGGWYTALYFANESQTTVSFTVTFTQDNGTPLNVPGVGTSQVVTLGPLGSTIIQALNTGNLLQGYVTVALPAGVSAYGVFRQSAPGVADQEALVNFKSATSTAVSMIFDNTSLTTSVALANSSSSAATVTITVYGPTGNVIGTSTVPLAAGNKTENVLSAFPGLGATAGQRGSVLFTTTTGTVSVLGVRFGATAFTSVPTTVEQ